MAKALTGNPPLKIGTPGRRPEIKALQRLLAKAGFDPGLATG